MDPIPTPAMALYRRALSTPSNDSSGTLHISSALSTVIFASIVGLLLLLGLCYFMRRRSISDTRTRRVHHLRSSISSSFERQPANVVLPIRKYAKEEMGGDGRGTECCPVCLVEFEEGEEVKVVEPGCEHVFHPVCIDRWLARRNTCPVCRSAVMGEETYWVEELEEGDEGDVERDGGEGGEGEGEAVVNVENLVVSGEAEREGEVAVNAESVVVSGEGEGGERGEGEEEVVVNVESVVLSGEMDVRMNMESKGAEEREGEVEVNLERNREGGEGEGRGELEADSTVDMLDDDKSEGESSRKCLQSTQS